MFPPSTNTHTAAVNKENVGGSQLPQPHVKIIDLQHNLLPFEAVTESTAPTHASGPGGGVTGSGLIAGLSGIGGAAGRSIIDSQTLRNQIKQQRAQQGVNKELIQMSQHQQYLLQQMHNPHKQGNQHSLGYFNPSSSSGAAAGGHKSSGGSIGTAQVQPKTPNDIYGFAQKAILHSIFEKSSSSGGVVSTSSGIPGVNNSSVH